MSILKWLITDVFHPDSKKLFFIRRIAEKIVSPKILYDLDELDFRLEVDKSLLRMWVNGTPSGYEHKKFKIKKRRSGYRFINSPNKPLKKLQQNIYHKLLKPGSLDRSIDCVGL